MVVRPQDLEKQFDKEQEALIQAIERKIDAELTRDWVPGKTIDVTVGNRVHEKVVNLICRKYRAVGWQISYQYCDDQRDGGYSSFRVYAPESVNRSVD